jgi:tRNA (mo5U34)-methyltransferase
MDIRDVRYRAAEFAKTLRDTKAALRPTEFWYPFDSMWNFDQFDDLLQNGNRDLDRLIDGKPVADIGGGDGDCAFFLETLGNQVQLVDNPPTNFNRLEGARLLKEAFSSSVEIVEADLDGQFALPEPVYGTVFFLGLLYHLKNPYCALEALSHKSRYCFLSTRVAKFSPGKRSRIADIPVAYLLKEGEVGGDPTNYWIFSPAGLRRLLWRTGWRVCSESTSGWTTDSEPVRLDKDERLFALLSSRRPRLWE